MIRVLFAMTLLMFSFIASASNAVKDASLAIQGEMKTSIATSFSVKGIEYKNIKGIQDFTIENRSGANICEIYVSPDYSPNWEENILDGRRMVPGQSLKVIMNGYGNYCGFDIKVVSCQGQSLIKRVDLCSVSTLTIN